LPIHSTASPYAWGYLDQAAHHIFILITNQNIVIGNSTDQRLGSDIARPTRLGHRPVYRLLRGH